MGAATEPALPLHLLYALEAARRRYRRYPNVLGVAAGFKLRKRRPVTGAGPAVQFFVERKVEKPSRRLPRYVLGRDRRGRALRGVRIPTDVIATPAPRFACRSGSSLRASGERGSLALVFRDRSAGGPAGGRWAGFFLLTCAHVAGDLERSPPLSPAIRLSRRPGREPFAVTLKNTLARRGVVEHDLALARVERTALPVEELLLPGGRRLRGWLEADGLRLGTELELSAASGRRRAPLWSLRGELEVRLDGRPYRVRNLWGLRAAVREGDSGGLVHAGGRAAGVVVARSRGGFAWWQPLRPALEHLNRSPPRTRLDPFGAA